MSVCGVTARGNKEQAELIRLIQQNDIKIVYCVGNAGTGKTFISLATALQMIYDGKFGNKRGKIYYIREPIEVGKSLGFLPGDLNEKFDVKTEMFASPVNFTFEKYFSQFEDVDKYF